MKAIYSEVPIISLHLIMPQNRRYILILQYF